MNLFSFSNQFAPHNSVTMCKATIFMKLCLTLTSQNELILLSMDRYIAVSRPTWYTEKLMKKVFFPLKCTLINFICSALISSSSFRVSDYNFESDVCIFDEDLPAVERIAYVTLVVGFFYSILPIVSTSIFNAAVICKLRYQN